MIHELIEKGSLVVAGTLIGWLLRWKRDKYYFDAIKDEVMLMKKMLKHYQDKTEE